MNPLILYYESLLENLEQENQSLRESQAEAGQYYEDDEYGEAEYEEGDEYGEDDEYGEAGGAWGALKAGVKAGYEHGTTTASGMLKNAAERIGEKRAARAGAAGMGPRDAASMVSRSERMGGQLGARVGGAAKSFKDMSTAGKVGTVGLGMAGAGGTAFGASKLFGGRKKEAFQEALANPSVTIPLLEALGWVGDAYGSGVLATNDRHPGLYLFVKNSILHESSAGVRRRAQMKGIKTMLDPYSYDSDTGSWSVRLNESVQFVAPDLPSGMNAVNELYLVLESHGVGDEYGEGLFQNLQKAQKSISGGIRSGIEGIGGSFSKQGREASKELAKAKKAWKGVGKNASDNMYDMYIDDLAATQNLTDELGKEYYRTGLNRIGGAAAGSTLTLGATGAAKSYADRQEGDEYGEASKDKGNNRERNARRAALGSAIGGLIPIPFTSELGAAIGHGSGGGSGRGGVGAAGGAFGGNVVGGLGGALAGGLLTRNALGALAGLNAGALAGRTVGAYGGSKYFENDEYGEADNDFAQAARQIQNMAADSSVDEEDEGDEDAGTLTLAGTGAQWMDVDADDEVEGDEYGERDNSDRGWSTGQKVGAGVAGLGALGLGALGVRKGLASRALRKAASASSDIDVGKITAKGGGHVGNGPSFEVSNPGSFSPAEISRAADKEAGLVTRPGAKTGAHGRKQRDYGEGSYSEQFQESEAFRLLTEAVMQRISTNQANQHYSTLPAYFPAGGVTSDVINSQNPLVATYGLVAQQQSMNLRRTQPSQPSRARRL